MRLALVLLVILFSTPTALAQTRNAIPGKPLILYRTASANPDCTSAGEVVIRVTEAPRYGRVSISRSGVFLNFPASNPRSVCNHRRIPGTVATYVAQRGYAGPDSLSLEAIYPTGELRQGSFQIMVR